MAQGHISLSLTPRLEELRRPWGARPGRLLPESRRSRRQRRGATLRSPWQCLGNPPPGVQGVQSKGGVEVAGEADLGGGSGGRDPRDFPLGTVDHGPERVSISECLRPGFSFICLGRDFSFSLSKRSHGLTDLAPRKALKTTPACAASAAPGLVVQPTFSQGAPQRGAQAAPVTVERVPEAGSSAEAAIVIGEAADADVALRPPDVPAMPAPAATEVVVVPVGGDRSPPTLRRLRRRRSVPRKRGAWRRNPSRRAAASSLCGRAPRAGASCSGSEPVRPRIPSSFSTMNGRTSPGMSSASVPKQQWGRSGRRWRFSAGTSPKSSR
jgi:hypothetical protein